LLGTLRILEPGASLGEGRRVHISLERRSRQQFTAFSLELRVEPTLLRQQLVDLGPAIPTRGGPRRDDQQRWRPTCLVLESGRDELRRAPGMALVDRLLRRC